MQTDAFNPSLCRKHLSKPHVRSPWHTQQSSQHSTGHPLVCASNEAEQGSSFFFLSRNGTAAFAELILRSAGTSSKYKKKRLMPSSNQRKMSSQQSRAIRTLHINPAVGQYYCQFDNTLMKKGLRDCSIFFISYLEVLFVAQQKHKNKAVSDMGGRNVVCFGFFPSHRSFFENIKMKEEIKKKPG